MLLGIGALAVPSMGVLIAAGPIITALGGAVIRGGHSGIVSGLIGRGVPEIEAKRYEGMLKAGNYLISVYSGGDDEGDRAKTIFKDARAKDIMSSFMSVRKEEMTRA